MFLDFLEKRSEEVDDTPRLTDEEKLFLKVFGIEEDQPAAAMKEATYFTCIKKLSEAVAKTPLYLTQDTETGERRAKEHPLYELLSLRPNPYMTAVDFWKAIEATRQHEGIAGAVKVYLYVYNYVDNTTIYIKDVEVLGKYEDHAEAQFTVANDAIEAEVKRAEGIEDELRSSIQVNANKITSKVEKGDMGSYITQYYNNVLVAFNNSSKYVQISAGQIAIYNGEVTTKGKRAVFDQSGNAFYRDNYFVGRIGTNEWKSNSAHKGLTFDLEYQGKYMAWAQEESSSATSYDTILCYSRANSIYTEKGLHFGCNVYAHGWNLYNADLRNTSYDGYSSWTGEIPIITKIQANSDGTITWWSSSITVRNGGITSAPRS